MAVDLTRASGIPGEPLGPEGRKAETAAEISFDLLYKEALTISDDSSAASATEGSNDGDLLSSFGPPLSMLDAGLNAGEGSGSEPAVRLLGGELAQKIGRDLTHVDTVGAIDGQTRPPSDGPWRKDLPSTPVENDPATAHSAASPLKKRLTEWMDTHALTHSTHRCAMFFRRAMEAAGIHTADRPSSGDAADYGPFLLEHGAQIVSLDSYRPEVGDTAVFARTPQHPAGHIEVFDGERWVSDFVQHGFSPYSRAAGAPAFTIYRLS